MIPLLGERAVTRLRYGAPVMTNGRATRPTPSTLAITIGPQPAPRKVLDALPDGMATSDVLVCVSYAEVSAGGEGAYPDVIRVPAGLDIIAGDYQVHESHISVAFESQPASVYVVAYRVQP